MSISCGRGCIFEHFAVMRLKTSKMASRRPQEAPKSLQESPQSLQEGPRGSKMASRGPQDAPKTAPRRPQDGPKTAPASSSPQVGLKMAPVASKMPPRRLQDGSRWHHDGKMATRRRQDPSRRQLDANLGPTWPNLAASWRHHDGKSGHFVWEGLHF